MVSLGGFRKSQNNLPKVIHIAGTNGKGSTLSMLRAGLNEIGLKTHAYTSPHLVRFHERIQLHDNFIDENALTEILDECYSANKNRPITYFEILLVPFWRCRAKS